MAGAWRTSGSTSSRVGGIRRAGLPPIPLPTPRMRRAASVIGSWSSTSWCRASKNAVRPSSVRLKAAIRRDNSPTSVGPVIVSSGRARARRRSDQKATAVRLCYGQLGPNSKGRISAIGTDRWCRPVRKHFRCWRVNRRFCHGAGPSQETSHSGFATSLPDSDISIRHCAHQGGSISPLIIFTTCDASANSVATIAKVTLTKLSLGRSSSINNF